LAAPQIFSIPQGDFVLMPEFLEANGHFLGILICYSAAVVLASVFGGLLPEWFRLTHNRMQLMISFVGGVMLGIAIFHMIPHALAVLGPGKVDQVMWGAMLGLLTTFFLLRFFHFHQHEPVDFGLQRLEASSDPSHRSTETAALQPSHDHSSCDGRHVKSVGFDHATGLHSGTARWMAVLVGLGLHTLLDGVALASGIAAEIGHGNHGFLPGLGIFLAVLLHKPLDAVSITSLMHPVTTASKRLWVNIGFALMCPIGALLFWAGANWGSDWSVGMAGWGLAFSAGVFLCISLSDLLPEMEFHSHSRIPLTVALLLGITAAWTIGLLEGEHAHNHEPHFHSPAAVDDADAGGNHH
jgi:zinc and cadmium transporter